MQGGGVDGDASQGRRASIMQDSFDFYDIPSQPSQDIPFGGMSEGQTCQNFLRGNAFGSRGHSNERGDSSIGSNALQGEDSSRHYQSTPPRHRRRVRCRRRRRRRLRIGPWNTGVKAAKDLD